MRAAVPARLPRTPAGALELRPRPPFRLDLTVWALRRRPQNRIDAWDGRIYRRVLLVESSPVELAVRQVGRPTTPRLEMHLSGRTTTAKEDAARAALTRLLGVELDLSRFYARAATEPLLAPLAGRYRGLKPPRFSTLFECLLNAVACQQLSIDAGLTLLNRLAAAAAPAARQRHPFPAPERVCRLTLSQLRQIGFSTRKAETIVALAQAAADGDLEAAALDRAADASVRAQLTRRPGIGPWSADYVLLRGLGRLHVFPRRDIGALNGLRRFLADNGVEEEPETALRRWPEDAGLVYFHLLLRSLEQRGALVGGWG